MLTRSVSSDCRIEAGIQRHEVPDRPDHEARADEEHDRHRQLGDDEHAAKPLRSLTVAAARGFLERAVEIDRARLQAGDEADEQTAGAARPDRECRDTDIEPRASRNSGRLLDFARRARRPRRERASGRRGAERRQHAALRDPADAAAVRVPRPPPCERRSRAGALPIGRSSSSRRWRTRSAERRRPPPSASAPQDASAPNSSTSSGLTSTPRFSLVSGYARSSCFEIPSSSVCAAAIVTPGLSRASAVNPAIAAAVHRLAPRRPDREGDPQLRACRSGP